MPNDPLGYEPLLDNPLAVSGEPYAPLDPNAPKVAEGAVEPNGPVDGPNRLYGPLLLNSEG